jgi:hypothetical protein
VLEVFWLIDYDDASKATVQKDLCRGPDRTVKWYDELEGGGGNLMEDD